MLQFALFGGAFAVDVLHMVHDHVLDRWHRLLTVY